MSRDRLAGLRNAPQQETYNPIPSPPQTQYGYNGQQHQAYAPTNAYEMNNVQQPPADFWQEIGQIRTSLSQLQTSIGQIKSLHAISLNSTTGPPPELSSQVEETRELAQSVKMMIKSANANTQGDRGKKAQVKGVKEQFLGLLQEYQSVERMHRSKVKQRAERQFKIVKPDATPQEMEAVLESDNPQIFQQALLSSNRYGQASSAYKEVQQRHEDIQRIERTLTELAQLFNDMAMLIEQQDETINVVEQQATQVNQDMETGNEQLDKGIVSARKARRKRWICFWLIIVILIIIAAIVAAVVVTQVGPS
ncbi:SNARE protein Syntaxin 1 and related proteins [Phaffia rhodozyma]|uniref:SNARE protein Syntaxin 1 and related proteins n=1 Tax=Phaffia rhodozyma TaxID=264483 RepID=A0A0F7SM34_PHARH|nr:SNARE protein Syntaxin 1 and related proteins [Phaffia rhodozyma]